MITEKDIKRLTQYQTRAGKISYWMIMIFPIFVLIIGIMNLHTASRIGNYEGYDLMHLFKSWLHGINIRATYSGLYLAAMNRLITALTEIAVSFMAAIVAYGLHKRKKMDERIMEALKNNGKIESITKRSMGSA